MFRAIWSGSVRTQQFTLWCEIGLLAPVDGPEFMNDDDESDPWNDIDPMLTPVSCLVCHRFVGAVISERRRYDGSRIETDSRQFRELELLTGLNRPGSIEDMQAHLITHFLLEFDPINMASSKKPSWLEMVEFKNGMMLRKRARNVKNKLSLRNRLRWENAVSGETLAYLWNKLVEQTGSDVNQSNSGKEWRTYDRRSGQASLEETA